MQKTIAKINIEALCQNAELFKSKTETRLCAVVKADAYGHGAETVVCALSNIADLFAVAIIEEGLAIRVAACGKDILVFTPPQTEEEAFALAENGFIATIPDLFTAKLFARTCKKYGLVGRVHLKSNTGMNRYGMNPSMLGKVCRLLQGDKNVSVEGLYSHLYECRLQTARLQLARFAQMQRIAKRYFNHLTCHISATYGALLGKEFALDMVRVGIGLYGYAPVETDRKLRRVMTVRARVVCNRKYAFGGVGYGKQTAQKGARLTVCRVGYADGFLRKRENGTQDAQNNANALCMDVCIRFGNKRRGAWVSVLADAEETARKTGTISYEVLCAATRRAEKRYEWEEQKEET